MKQSLLPSFRVPWEDLSRTGMLDSENQHFSLCEVRDWLNLMVVYDAAYLVWVGVNNLYAFIWVIDVGYFVLEVNTFSKIIASAHVDTLH